MLLIWFMTKIVLT